MSDELLATLGGLPTSALSDALDRLGLAGQCLGIMPLDPGFRLVGRAWTLRYGPVLQDVGTVGDYIDDVGAEEIVVLDNQGRLDATVWGDLLTETASRRGVAGTVIDGVCRDRDRTREPTQVKPCVVLRLLREGCELAPSPRVTRSGRGLRGNLWEVPPPRGTSGSTASATRIRWASRRSTRS